MSLDLNKSYEYFHPENATERIHIIGCGSVGATLAENLVRLGLTKFDLWDFDKVESHNLANQIFRQQDIGRLKVEALADILYEINPDVKHSMRIHPEGWQGEQLSGYIFLCVDSIDLRKQIVDQHMSDMSVRLMMDFRTGLEDAQHFAADWSSYKSKKEFRGSMNFTDAEANAEVPVSACGIALGVNPTVRGICAVGAANFVNFINGKGLKKMVVFDVFNFVLDAF